METMNECVKFCVKILNCFREIVKNPRGYIYLFAALCTTLLYVMTVNAVNVIYGQLPGVAQLGVFKAMRGSPKSKRQGNYHTFSISVCCLSFIFCHFARISEFIYNVLMFPTRSLSARALNMQREMRHLQCALQKCLLILFLSATDR